jgi:hypothetical protein
MVIKLKSTCNIFDCCYKIESKYLFLSYPSIEEQTEECWEKNIMDIHEQYSEYNILENTEHIFLDSDFYFSFPQVFFKFMNLKKLEISGARWWNLNCNQIPVSIEHLLLVNHTNLQNDVMKGGENLINLHTLELDGFPFFADYDFSIYDEINHSEYYNQIYEYDNTYPIPDIGKLKKIILHINDQRIDYLKYYIFQYIIKNHKLFSNIKNRINKIYVDDETKNIIIDLI